jgi:hypothetical protein
MKKYIFLIMAMPMLMLMWQCSEVENWQSPSDNVAPDPIIVTKVENLHGGAIIKFLLPGDKDLMGVKAVYKYNESSGETKESYTSAFTNSIELVGFNDTEVHTVTLYAVDKSGNLSTPVYKYIEPLTSPVELIRQSLKINVAYGSIVVNWENRFNSSFDINLYRMIENGKRILTDRHHPTESLNTEGTYTFRDLESVEREYRIELIDRWDNSVYLDTVITPLSEWWVLINKKELKVHSWSDAYFQDVRNIIDDDLTTMWHSWYETIHWENAPLPHWIIVDMVKIRKIARIETWRRDDIQFSDTKTIRFYLGEDPEANTLDPDTDPAWKSIGEVVHSLNIEGDIKRTVDIDPGIDSSGRFLKIYFPDSYRAPSCNLCEITLYGTE